MAPWAFLDHPGPLAFAHRGGAGDWPENTMPAFEHAVRLGYRYLETDVHATVDGVLLAFHDDSLDRVTDRQGEIAALPYAEVAAARVDGREPIPLLEELLGSFPRARINIDPKHDGSVEPLIDVLRRTDAVDRVCIGSFSDQRLRTPARPPRARPLHVARAQGGGPPPPRRPVGPGAPVGGGLRADPRAVPGGDGDQRRRRPGGAPGRPAGPRLDGRRAGGR